MYVFVIVGWLSACLLDTSVANFYDAKVAFGGNRAEWS